MQIFIPPFYAVRCELSTDARRLGCSLPLCYSFLDMAILIFSLAMAVASFGWFVVIMYFPASWRRLWNGNVHYRYA